MTGDKRYAVRVLCGPYIDRGPLSDSARGVQDSEHVVTRDTDVLTCIVSAC